MAYTTPTPYFESVGNPASSHDGLKEFSVWLNGRHATQSNAAPWQIIDCYDGTTREQPAGGDSANLSPSNKWREDQAIPPQGSWIVWQAPTGGPVVARYQFYAEMNISSGAFFGIFMLNDWAIGAGSDANPTIPATSLGVPPFAGGMDGAFANHTDYVWRAVADEGGIVLGCYPTVAGFPEFLHIGDLKPDNPGTIDPRPFVISASPDADGWAAVYLHVSVVDDSTIISTQDEVAQSFAFEDAQDQDAGWSRRPLSEVSCFSNASGNYYRKGKFRLASAISRHARTVSIERVTAGIGATDYDFEVWGRGGTSAAQIVTRNGAGVILDRHITLVARTLP